MKIATAAYPLDVLSSWAHYEDKLAGWVATAAASGAELLVFPEYGAMELATLAGLDVAGNLEASLFAVSDRLADADATHQKLAAEYGVYIVAGHRCSPPSGKPRPPDHAFGANRCAGQTDHDPIRTRGLGRGRWRAFAHLRDGIGQDQHPDLL